MCYVVAKLICDHSVLLVESKKALSHQSLLVWQLLEPRSLWSTVVNRCDIVSQFFLTIVLKSEPRSLRAVEPVRC